jgi:hypothetical protein
MHLQGCAFVKTSGNDRQIHNKYEHPHSIAEGLPNLDRIGVFIIAAHDA